MMSEIQVGKITGLNAGVNLSLGFIPAALVLLNLTDPGILFWTHDYGTGDGTKLTDAPALTTIATGGIDVYTGGDEPDGTNTYQDATGTALTIFSTSGQVTEQGFTIGSDADINGTGDAIKFIALGRSPQAPPA